LGFLLAASFGKDTRTFHNGLLIAAIMGFLVWIAWWTATLRLNKTHAFRMAQANAAEPDGWKLLRDDGKRFSLGGQVVITDPDTKKAEKYQQRWPARLLRPGIGAYVPVIVFLLAWGGLILAQWGLLPTFSTWLLGPP
jgi:hypothetical protein